MIARGSGWSARWKRVTTPGKPGPAPRAAQRSSAFWSSSACTSSPSGVTTSIAWRLRQAGPQAPVFQPSPPLSRKPLMPTDGQCPTGKASPRAASASGQLRARDRGLHRGGARRLVDRQLAQRREVDQQGPVAQRRAHPAVAAGSHCHLEAARAGQLDRRHHVRLGGGADDRLGVAGRLQGVPEHALPGRLVLLVAAPDDGAFDRASHDVSLPLVGWLSRGRTGSRRPGGGGSGP